ncbi:hypothetical protein LTR56_017975 [Elasticomyces elasticus]|nr:hypothetical protein LTR56_017975 [Elasticomyces elasticus]KAK3637176.1 hypothetical protein LTR22_018366 [Elasticomyces elasticus]KAK4914249.1 hypothetical protein LTR49_017492 [Elasticomyces elasticus]KAK5749659.1 hypothetical protein LTS12_020297 [Elasticomyces elasticus]
MPNRENAFKRVFFIPTPTLSFNRAPSILGRSQHQPGIIDMPTQSRGLPNTVPVQELYKKYQEIKLQNGLDNDSEVRVAGVSLQQIQKRTEMIKKQRAIMQQLRERGGIEVAGAVLTKIASERPQAANRAELIETEQKLSFLEEMLAQTLAELQAYEDLISNQRALRQTHLMYQGFTKKAAPGAYQFDARMYESASLLGLPVELREMIWRYALVENEPLVSYIGKCVVRSRYGEHRAKLVRRTTLYPKTPALARVSKMIRWETMPTWYGGNIFAFRVDHDDQDDGEVERWLKARREPVLFFDLKRDRNHTIHNLSKVDLEFQMYSDAAEGPSSAGINIRSAVGASKLSLSFTGVLARECTCSLTTVMDDLSEDPSNIREVAAEMYEGWEQEAIGAFAKRIEWNIGNWQSNDREDGNEYCSTCEKPRYMGPLDEHGE